MHDALLILLGAVAASMGHWIVRDLLHSRDRSKRW